MEKWREKTGKNMSRLASIFKNLHKSIRYEQQWKSRDWNEAKDIGLDGVPEFRIVFMTE